jgi:abequosyltransferase
MKTSQPINFKPIATIGICIPTYNRAFYLDRLLQSLSIEARQNANIRIFISDNCSSDETEEIIMTHAKSIDVRYKVNKHNLGADQNFIQAMRMADTDYVWLLGSDDLAHSDSVKLISSKIDKWMPDIMIGSRFEFEDNNPENLRLRKWSSQVGDQIIDSGDKEAMQRYFKSLDSIGGAFSYLSSIVYKRSCLNLDDPSILDYYGTAYSHTYVLLKALSIAPLRLLATEDALVLCRLGNDGFLSQLGISERIRLDFVGYLKLSHSFKSYSKILGILAKEHSQASLQACFSNQPRLISVLTIKNIFLFSRCKIPFKTISTALLSAVLSRGLSLLKKFSRRFTTN